MPKSLGIDDELYPVLVESLLRQIETLQKDSAQLERELQFANYCMDRAMADTRTAEEKLQKLKKANGAKNGKSRNVRRKA